MTRIKRALAACLAALTALTLSGCRLAREDAGEDGGGERLIGVLITTEYLDLFDAEAYFNDNADRLIRGGEISLGGGGKYQGHLYASLATRALTDETTGQTREMKEYVFDTVAGIPYFSATMPAAQFGESFIMSSSDEAVSEGRVGLYYGDDEDKITLEGTIYLSPSRANHTCYINPVYQDAQGGVFAVSGSGFSTDGAGSEGTVFTQTLEETKTVTQNRVRKSRSVSVKISIAVMRVPERIVILQLDANSAVLSRREYAPGALPERLAPEAGAAFLIVETHKRGEPDKGAVARALYDSGETALETFYCREDGVCVKCRTQLDWAGGAKAH